jgi:hypothetical protein
MFGWLKCKVNEASAIFSSTFTEVHYVQRTSTLVGDQIKFIYIAIAISKNIWTHRLQPHLILSLIFQEFLFSDGGVQIFFGRQYFDPWTQIKFIYRPSHIKKYLDPPVRKADCPTLRLLVSGTFYIRHALDFLRACFFDAIASAAKTNLVLYQKQTTHPGDHEV